MVSTPPVVDVVEMLALQLTEVEMLASMFANPGEFELDDPTAVVDIQAFVDGEMKQEDLQSRIGFTVRIDIASGSKGRGPAKQQTLEAVCRLPHEYPTVRPEVFLRCDALSRTQHRKCSDDLQSFMQELEPGEICLGSVIQWLQDNSATYIDASQTETVQTAPKPAKKRDKFCRMWIYSHHIYNKVKRKAILDYSAEMNLTGFCMPGKPGIICVEGDTVNVEDFWQRIRSMTWKKIMMKHREDFKLGEEGEAEFQKFKGFEEKAFDPWLGKGRNYHMDRGQLFQFLEKHGCGDVFVMYFGVEGKAVAEDDSD